MQTPYKEIRRIQKLTSTSKTTPCGYVNMLYFSLIGWARRWKRYLCVAPEILMTSLMTTTIIARSVSGVHIWDLLSLMGNRTFCAQYLTSIFQIHSVRSYTTSERQTNSACCRHNPATAHTALCHFFFSPDSIRGYLASPKDH